MLITRPELFAAALRGQRAPQAKPAPVVATPRGLPLAAAFQRQQQATREAEALRRVTTPAAALVEPTPDTPPQE
jgi:hypothetical protein